MSGHQTEETSMMMRQVKDNVANSYIPIHLHTYWSKLDSSIDIKSLCKRFKELGIPAACMTDHNNIKGVVSFVQECKSNDVKPIIGCEFDLLIGEELGRVTLIARNKQGYKNIVKLISEGNIKKNLDRKKGQFNLTLDDLLNYRSGLLCLIGDIRSELSLRIFSDWNTAYKANTIEECRELLDPNWKAVFRSVMSRYINIYDKKNIFLFTDASSLPLIRVLNECIREMSAELSIDWLPSNNLHYIDEGDKELHQIVIQSKIESEKMSCKLEDAYDHRIFFTEKPCCHLFSNMPGGEKTFKVLDLIEDYEIREPPILPKYKMKGHTVHDEHEVLRRFCREGFVKLGLHEELQNDKELKKVYSERAKHELDVVQQVGISGYFLIVKDIIDYCRECGVPADVRGSGTGSLLVYLLGISSVDPIRPDPSMGYKKELELLFERFYNLGRNTGDNVSLPDLDVDVPPSFRGKVIEYINKKYGKACVAHVITHSRFKGKGAIKEVCRLKNINFNVANEITKDMVDEAKISDELAEIREKDPEYGIIRWNVDHVEKVGEFYKEYTEIFDLAMRLEKIPRHNSVHAAAIIMADRQLDELFPLCYSKKLDERIIDIEGYDVEYLGGLKMDILGLMVLEKIYKIQQMVNYNKKETDIGMEEREGFFDMKMLELV